MNFILSYFASESSLLITKLRFQIRLTFFSLAVPRPPFPYPALMQGYLYFTFVFRTLKPFLWSTSIAFYLSMLLPSFLSKYFHGIWLNRSFQIWRFPPSLSYCSFHSPIYPFCVTLCAATPTIICAGRPTLWISLRCLSWSLQSFQPVFRGPLQALRVVKQWWKLSDLRTSRWLCSKFWVNRSRTEPDRRQLCLVLRRFCRLLKP